MTGPQGTGLSVGSRAAQSSAIGANITSIGKSILAWHRSCEPSLRLEEIPGMTQQTLRRDVPVLNLRKKNGSTQVAFGFLTRLVSFDFGLMTVLSCSRIWFVTVRDQPVPIFPMQTGLVPSCLPSGTRKGRWG